MAAHIPEGAQSVDLSAFLGMLTNVEPESIPEGGSPICFDCDFLVGSVFTRPGLFSAYTFCQQ